MYIQINWMYRSNPFTFLYCYKSLLSLAQPRAQREWWVKYELISHPSRCDDYCDFDFKTWGEAEKQKN